MSYALKVRLISIGFAATSLWARLLHRLKTPLGLRLRHVDHLTLPCRDLAVAEKFYVELLGARVLMRADEEFLRRHGRPPAEISRAIHLSLVLSGGPRIDLFVDNDKQPPPLSGHPHYAFAIPPQQMLKWKQRLLAANIPCVGPTRLGPPGQASLYFNDPSGNHLELVTMGFPEELPIGAPDMSKLDYEWRARS